MSRGLIDIGELSRLLADRIDQLVPHLLSGAVKVGSEWQCGSIAGERGKSMSINAGAKRGVWKDFGGDGGGDALDLVAAVLFAGNKGEAIKWAKSWLGLDNLSPERMKQMRVEASVKARDADMAAQQDAARKAKAAKAIWLASLPQLGGSPVDNYLINRSIDMARLPRIPAAIRYAPSLEYYDTVTGEVTKWPAMVAQIVCPQNHIAIHRTYLDERQKVWRKAPVEKPKLTLGAWRGGYIPIARGLSGKPMAQAPEGDTVIIAEGIEDALSLAILYPEYRVIAAVSIGNMANIELPNTISDVHIAVDNDINNKQADAAIQKAVKKFQIEGRDVYTKRSPVGKDFNDLLQHKAATDYSALSTTLSTTLSTLAKKTQQDVRA